MKHKPPSRSTDALIGDEEQKGKQKRTKRKKQGERRGNGCLEENKERKRLWLNGIVMEVLKYGGVSR